MLKENLDMLPLCTSYVLPNVTTRGECRHATSRYLLCATQCYYKERMQTCYLQVPLMCYPMLLLGENLDMLSRVSTRLLQTYYPLSLLGENLDMLPNVTRRESTHAIQCQHQEILDILSLAKARRESRHVAPCHQEIINTCYPLSALEENLDMLPLINTRRESRHITHCQYQERIQTCYPCQHQEIIQTCYPQSALGENLDMLPLSTLGENLDMLPLSILGENLNMLLFVSTKRF